MRLRIVDTTSAKHPGFLRIVVIRSWLVGLACYAAFYFHMSDGLSSIAVYLIGFVTIFGTERRSVHDLLARTRVVSVGERPSTFQRRPE